MADGDHFITKAPIDLPAIAGSEREGSQHFFESLLQSEPMSILFIAFAMPGPAELMIVMCIVLLLFGGSKLPSLMRNLGRAKGEFTKGMNENLEDEVESRENG